MNWKTWAKAFAAAVVVMALFFSIVFIGLLVEQNFGEIGKAFFQLAVFFGSTFSVFYLLFSGDR